MSIGYCNYFKELYFALTRFVDAWTNLYDSNKSTIGLCPSNRKCDGLPGNMGRLEVKPGTNVSFSPASPHCLLFASSNPPRLLLCSPRNPRRNRGGIRVSMRSHQGELV